MTFPISFSGSNYIDGAYSNGDQILDAMQTALARAGANTTRFPSGELLFEPRFSSHLNGWRSLHGLSSGRLRAFLEGLRVKLDYEVSVLHSALFAIFLATLIAVQAQATFAIAVLIVPLLFIGANYWRGVVAFPRFIRSCLSTKAL